MSTDAPKDFDDAFRDDATGERFRRAKAAADAAPPVQGRNDEGWEAPASLEKHPTVPFPVDVLPSWLGEFVRALAEESQTPPDVAGMLGLAVCGATVAGRSHAQPWEGYREPLNIFAIVALPPANRKSAVLGPVTRPLYDYEADEAKRMAPVISAAETRRTIATDRAARALKAAANETPASSVATQRAIQLAAERDTIVVPGMPRLVVDDCTPERLAGIMAANDGRIAVVSAEGGVFEQMGGRYARQGVPNLEVYLKGHSGDPLRVDRIGRPPEVIDRPALTLALTVQPDVVRGLTDKPGFRGRGLLGRCLFSFPVSLVGHRSFDAPPVPATVRAAYDHGIRALLALPVTAREPRPLAFSCPAREALRAFGEALEPRLAESGDLGPISDWAGKLVGAIVRLAGILHLAGRTEDAARWEEDVSEGTVAGAIELGHYLLDHARVAFSMMGEDPGTTGARFIVSWMRGRSATPFTERDAFSALRGRFNKMDELRSALDVCARHGYLRKAPLPPGGKPGRPSSPRYLPNILLERG